MPLPSENLFPSENLLPDNPTVAPTGVVVASEPIPDRLAVSVRPPGGPLVRWAEDEPAAENVIAELQLSDEMPGGYKEMSGTLARKPQFRWPDLEGFGEVKVYGPGVESVWEGRLERAPQASGDRLAISPAAVGWQAALEDNKAIRFLPIDKDLSHWGPMSRARRIALLGTAYKGVGDPQVSPDPATGLPGLLLEHQGPWNANALPVMEAWYDAGPGLAIAEIYADWQRHPTTTDPNWRWDLGVADDDLAAGLIGTADLQAEPASSGTVTFQPAPAKRHGRARFQWDVASDSPSSGPLAPLTLANDDPAEFPEGTVLWSNPGNAAASDDSRAIATLALGNISVYLKATNFGFTIPSGAVIKGIVVEVERSATIGVHDNAVRIVKGGQLKATDRKSADQWPGTDAYKTYGSSTDLWGESWTVGEINGSGFGAAINAIADVAPGSGDARIDHIRITVHYTDEGTRYGVHHRTPAVIGNHGMTVRGTRPNHGFYASDVLGYAIPTFAPPLKVDAEFLENDPTPFVIPHLTFLDFVTTAMIVRDTLRFSLLDWFVFRDKLFQLRRRRTYGRKWRARVGPSQLNEVGLDASRLWEEIVVRYQDVDGSTKTVGPPGAPVDVTDAGLRITDPDHPAVKAPVTRRDLLEMQDITTPAGAIAVGKGWLEEANKLSNAGTATLSGYIEDDRGTRRPPSQVHSGDEVAFVDASDTSYRRIVGCQYSHPQRAAGVDIDAPPEGLAALLERFQVVLVPLGLG